MPDARSGTIGIYGTIVLILASVMVHTSVLQGIMLGIDTNDTGSRHVDSGIRCVNHRSLENGIPITDDGSSTDSTLGRTITIANGVASDPIVIISFRVTNVRMDKSAAVLPDDKSVLIEQVGIVGKVGTIGKQEHVGKLITTDLHGIIGLTVKHGKIGSYGVGSTTLILARLVTNAMFVKGESIVKQGRSSTHGTTVLSGKGESDDTIGKTGKIGSFPFRGTFGKKHNLVTSIRIDKGVNGGLSGKTIIGHFSHPTLNVGKLVKGDKAVITDTLSIDDKHGKSLPIVKGGTQVTIVKTVTGRSIQQSRCIRHKPDNRFRRRYAEFIVCTEKIDYFVNSKLHDCTDWLGVEDCGD